MSDPDGEAAERDTVIVERTSGGGLIALVALVIATVAVLHYFGLLPV
ncbi:MAG: hypothetical protein ACM3YM_04305 [Sphingomonadales bacterium]